ncbi:MAG: SurA N-terminal domain-containing protein [Dysgonamonadaceae bacterium]|jgi:peptidyl-prolyl cis-trans isomerase D|nr:SurA N-terminal domain-containing protein [Dysgonamonadaceae bacterium]
MATLEKIRNNAKWALIIFIGLAMFAFVFDGFFRSGSVFFNSRKEKVIIVNGESVKIQDYQTRVERALEIYKAQSQNAEQTDEVVGQIRESIFNELVGTMLLEQECEKTGVAVGKAELYDMVVGDNISPEIQQISAFQNPQTGQFDRNIVLQFLQTIESDDFSGMPDDQIIAIQNEKENWVLMEKSIADSKKLAKLNYLIAGALVTNSVEAKAEYDENSVNVNFDFAAIPLSSVADSLVNVSSSEIKKLYEQKKNSFKQDGGKVIDYIAVNILPSEQDYNDVKEDMDKIKGELETSQEVAAIINEKSAVPYLDVFASTANMTPEQIVFVQSASVGAIDGPTLNNDTYSLYKLVDVKQAPDSIKLNLLMLPEIEEATLTHLTDSLIGVVKGGKSFADMALEVTGGQSNGDIGWQTETSLAQARDGQFAQDLFNAKLNEVFVLKTLQGRYFVQVVEKTKPVTKYKLGVVQIKVVPSTNTQNIAYNALNQFLSNNRSIEKFKSNAEANGYTCQTDVLVNEKQYSIANIGNSRQVIKWAFDHKKGDVSEIMECKDYFIVAALEGTARSGVLPLKDCEDQLRRELLVEKKGERIVKDLLAKNLSSFDNYRQAMNPGASEVVYLTFNQDYISGIGREPIINAKAIPANVGDLIGPFAGKQAVYVLHITDKKTSDTPYDETTQKVRLNSDKSMQVMTGLRSFELLKQGAKIEDYRIRFF